MKRMIAVFTVWMGLSFSGQELLAQDAISQEGEFGIGIGAGIISVILTPVHT